MSMWAILWETLTERARRVIYAAQEEAEAMGTHSVATEHLLLALIREDDAVAARLLDDMGVDSQKLRSTLEQQAEGGDTPVVLPDQNWYMTPAAKKVIVLSYEQMQLLGHRYIGTDHLLLGILAEGEGLAARVLNELGVDLDRTRRAWENLVQQG